MDGHPDGTGLGESDGAGVGTSVGQSGWDGLGEPLDEAEPEPDPEPELEPELEPDPDPEPPGAVEVVLPDGAECADVRVGDGLGDGFCLGVPPLERTPTGGPGSTGGSDGLCFGVPCRSGVVGSTGTVIPTAPLAYTFSRLMTVRT